MRVGYSPFTHRTLVGRPLRRSSGVHASGIGHPFMIPRHAVLRTRAGRALPTGVRLHGCHLSQLGGNTEHKDPIDGEPQGKLLGGSCRATGGAARRRSLRERGSRPPQPSTQREDARRVPPDRRRARRSSHQLPDMSPGRLIYAHQGDHPKCSGLCGTPAPHYDTRTQKTNARIVAVALDLLEALEATAGGTPEGRVGVVGPTRARRLLVRR
jgi:hypothetical protein